MVLPVKKYSAGSVQAAVWENEGKKGNAYYIVSLEKRFKASNGQWQSSHSFRAQEIPKAILTLQKAFEFVSLKR